MSTVYAEVNRIVASAIIDAQTIECREIAALIDAKAGEHEDAARDLKAEYANRDDDVSDEVWHHECDASMLRRLADEIRARWLVTVPEAVPSDEEIKF